MALTSMGIEQAREMFSEISNDVSKLTELSEVINFMNSNEEFSRFVSGTKFGNENYEKWKKLLNLISNDLFQAMTSLEIATNAFLNKHEEYNSTLVYSASLESNKISGTTGSGSYTASDTAEVYPGTPGPGSFTASDTAKVYPGTPGPVYTTPGFRVVDYGQSK